MARKLGTAERAVYEMVRHGLMTTLMARCFPRELVALREAGLIERDAAGRIFDSSPPPPADVRTIRVTLDLPPDVVAMLDQCAAAWGVTRHQAAERVLASVQHGGARATDAPTSGTRRAVKPPNA